MKGKAGDHVRLTRMRDQCDVLTSDIAGQNLETFIANRLLYDATVLRLLTIGEDAARLSDETKEAAREIAWHRIRGLRNIIAHGYSDLDAERLWEIAVDFVPPLQKEIERLLETTPPPALD